MERKERYLVTLTGEGFQILDTETNTLRADVWASRFRAMQACADMNEGKPVAKASRPNRAPA